MELLGLPLRKWIGVSAYEESEKRTLATEKMTAVRLGWIKRARERIARELTDSATTIKSGNRQGTAQVGTESEPLVDNYVAGKAKSGKLRQLTPW